MHRLLSPRVLPSLALLALLLAGCGSPNTHDVRGRVVGFGDDGRTILVEHEDVPGLMPAMTMSFTALRAGAVRDLQTGDAVAFSYRLTRDSSWIEQVRPLPDSAVAQHPAGGASARMASADTPILQAGDRLPAFSLVNQASGPIARDTFSGQVLVITFIYTNCPVPDYCPLMSQKFAQLQPRLKERFGAGRTALLSVSFDPARDTPAVLADYAARYTDDTQHWTFATGTEEQVATMTTAFGVFTRPDDDGAITHNLTTAVVGPDGRVQRIWRGNDWQPAAVAEAVGKALSDAGPAQPAS